MWIGWSWHGEGSKCPGGLVIPPRDAGSLAEAMIRMIEAPDAEVQRMADASLALVREKFDVHKVNQQMLEIMGL